MGADGLDDGGGVRRFDVVADEDCGEGGAAEDAGDIEGRVVAVDFGAGPGEVGGGIGREDDEDAIHGVQCRGGDVRTRAAVG